MSLRRGRPASGGRASLLAGLSLLVLASPVPARADLKVRSPLVEQGEVEVEHNGAVTFDHRSGLGRDQSYTYSLGYGVTPFWKLELEAETGAIPGGSLRYRATTIENTFQLTPQGRDWADWGFVAEYSRARRGTASTIKLGPIAQKETLGLGPYAMVHTLNLLFEREVGANSTGRTGFAPAFQSRIAVHPLFQPGVETFGAIDDLGRTGRFRQQQYSAGPVLVGAVSLAPLGNLRYELGYQFGLTAATPHGAARWRLEYELAF